MIKAAPALTFFGTPEYPVEGAPSLAYPSLATSEGITALNKLISVHGIDAMWAQSSARFNLDNVACEVHAAAAPEIIALLEDKKKFTDWLGDDPYSADTAEAVGVEEVAEEYERRREQGKEVCVKPLEGVSGQGYWKLTETPKVPFIHDPYDREIHPEVYFKALEIEQAKNGPKKLLVMDWLPGPEVSVDLLSWRGQPLIHAARTKLDRNTERVQSEHPVVEHARTLVGKLALHGITNVQYMLDTNSEWKILEINPRPAGGAVYGEDGGFGVISGWAKLVSHEAVPDDILQHHEDVLLTITKMATREALTSLNY